MKHKRWFAVFPLLIALASVPVIPTVAAESPAGPASGPPNGKLSGFIDKFSYNFHIDFRDNPKVNLALGGSQHERTVVLKNPELFARVWDDFSLLHGYVCVLENQPYVVTDTSGAYSFPNLPPGRYTITSAHWRTDRTTSPADLSEGNKQLDFKLLPKVR